MAMAIDQAGQYGISPHIYGAPRRRQLCPLHRAETGDGISFDTQIAWIIEMMLCIHGNDNRIGQ